MSKADQSCLGSGAPDYLAVLAKFYAKQMSETNTRTTKVKHALARWSTDKQTIPFQKRTSEMIRYYYHTSFHTIPYHTIPYHTILETSMSLKYRTCLNQKKKKRRQSPPSMWHSREIQIYWSFHTKFMQHPTYQWILLNLASEQKFWKFK